MDGNWALDWILRLSGWRALTRRLEAGERAKRDERDATLAGRVHLVPAHEETCRTEVGVELRGGAGEA